MLNVLTHTHCLRMANNNNGVISLNTQEEKKKKTEQEQEHVSTRYSA